MKVVGIEITATTTYEPVTENKEDIIRRNLLYMIYKCIGVKHELQCLPFFYWLPRLHKQRYSSRFIAASCKCTKYYQSQYTLYTIL